MAEEALVAVDHRSGCRRIGLLVRNRRIHAGLSVGRTQLQPSTGAGILALYRCIHCVRSVGALLSDLPWRRSAPVTLKEGAENLKNLLLVNVIFNNFDNLACK